MSRYKSKSMKYPLSPILASLAFALLPDPAARAMAQTAPVELRILAINDFHGYLRPPAGGIRIDDAADKTKKITVPAGGAEAMATLVKHLREGHANTIFVSAGDLIGASPFLSAMFHDEPTIESIGMMGLAISAVGNHEFDEGLDELSGRRTAAAIPIDGCQGPHPFTGANLHLSRRPPLSTSAPARPSSRLTRSGNSRAFRSPSSG